MYRRPKFLEILLEIRQEMALEADYDVDLFAEIVRSGAHSTIGIPAAAEGLASIPTDIFENGAELRKNGGPMRKK